MDILSASAQETGLRKGNPLSNENRMIRPLWAAHTILIRWTGSETVLVRDMLHNVLHTAVQNVAELINGVDLHMVVVAKPVDLCPIYIEMGIQVILGDTPVLHGLP